MNTKRQLTLAEQGAFCAESHYSPKVARVQLIKAQRGFDLVQIAIVVGVIGVLMAAAFVGVPRVMASVRATGEAQDLQAFALAHQEIPATVDVNTAYLAANNLYPRSQLTASTPGATAKDADIPGKYVNRFGGDITLTHADLVTTVLSKAIPTLACEKLVPIVAGSFRAVTVGTTIVKSVNGPLAAPSTFKTACNGAGGIVDITLTLKR